MFANRIFCQKWNKSDNIDLTPKNDKWIIQHITVEKSISIQWVKCHECCYIYVGLTVSKCPMHTGMSVYSFFSCWASCVTIYFLQNSAFAIRKRCHRVYGDSMLVLAYIFCTYWPVMLTSCELRAWQIKIWSICPVQSLYFEMLKFFTFPYLVNTFFVK